jgi:hypothetical protein
VSKVQEVLRDDDGDLISLGYKFPISVLPQAVFCYVHGCTREEEIHGANSVLNSGRKFQMMLAYPKACPQTGNLV